MNKYEIVGVVGEGKLSFNFLSIAIHCFWQMLGEDYFDNNKFDLEVVV